MSKDALIIDCWEQLVGLESDNYKLEINTEIGNGWIVAKNDNVPELERKFYLSTHTFYKSTYLYAEKRLRLCGFNVKLKHC